MKNIKEQITNEILNILKKESVKNEFKTFLKPMIDLILQEIYPYIFLSLTFVFISFMLTLAIFTILLKIKIN